MSDSRAVVPVADHPAETIPRLLAASAARSPDAAAILAPGRPPLRFRRLLRQIDETLRALNALGLGVGDRIALALPEGPESAVALLAVASGATAVPLSPDSTADEVAFSLGQLGARALLVEAGSTSPARRVATERGIPVVEVIPVAEVAAGIFLIGGSAGARRPDGAKHPGPDDVAVLLHTSGTTDRPRFVPLTQANVCAAALANVQYQGLTDSDRFLNLMRMFHIAFITNLFASLAAGASVVCPSGFQAPRFFAWLEEFHPTWFMAAPATHRVILDRAPAYTQLITRCPLRFVRSGGAPLSDALLTEVEATFGAPMTQVYGLTEVSALSAVPLPPRPRKPGSVGMAVVPGLAIMGEAGEFLQPGVVGEVVGRGPSVFHGYEGDKAATEAAFTAEGWFRTGDLGYLDEDGYLFLTGRLKELINRGGEKVVPGEVEAVLLAHPAVGEAAVFAVPDERLGEEVAAAVVPGQGGAATERELQEWAATRLAPFKVPRRVALVDELPKGPTGKVRRLGLARALGFDDPTPPASGPGPDFVAPRTPIEEVVAAVWAEELGLAAVGVDYDFLDLGGDSLLATQMVARLNQALGLDLTVATLFGAPTVGAIALIVEEALLREAERRPVAESGAIAG